MSSSSEEKMEHVIKGDRSVLIQQQKTQSLSNYPQHYAIIVDETQLRVRLVSCYETIDHLQVVTVLQCVV